MQQDGIVWGVEQHTKTKEFVTGDRPIVTPPIKSGDTLGLAVRLGWLGVLIEVSRVGAKSRWLLERLSPF